MLSLQEISDRFELQDLVYEYAHIIDTRNFDALRDIFTEDAYIDYSVYGGDDAKGSVEPIIAYLHQALVPFSASHHLNANTQFKIDGDTATGRIMCFNPMEMSATEDHGEHTFLLGLYYLDNYVRTDKGWRISRRVEESSWAMATPDFMPTP